MRADFRLRTLEAQSTSFNFKSFPFWIAKGESNPRTARTGLSEFDPRSETEPGTRFGPGNCHRSGHHDRNSQPVIRATKSSIVVTRGLTVGVGEPRTLSDRGVTPPDDQRRTVSRSHAGFSTGSATNTATVTRRDAAIARRLRTATFRSPRSTLPTNVRCSPHRSASCAGVRFRAARRARTRNPIGC